MAARKKENPEKKDAKTFPDTRSVRDAAERKLADSHGKASELTGQTAEALIHELRVHQIELEIQAEELKEAHLALEESRDKYHDLYEFAPIGYLTLTDKALIAEVNISGATLLGVPRKDLVNHGFGRFIVHGDLERWDQYFMHVRNPGGKQICTLTLKRGDGSQFPARLEGVRISDSSEGTPTVRISVSDITDIRQAEEALRESEERFDQLAEHSNTITWEVDGRGLYTYVSHVTEAVWGYRPDELVGRMHYYDLHPESGREAFKTATLAVFDRKEPFQDLENVTQTKDGRDIWVSTNGIPLLNADGTLRGYRGSNADITERKQGEEELRKFSEGLERMVVDRTANISDINQKLVAEIDIRLDVEKQLTKTVGEKEVLLREVHHRVKNNLQIIISLLNLQSRYMTDEATLSAFRESQNRIKAMALVHEKLYQSTDVSKINLDNYIRFLGDNLLQFFGMKGKGITFTTDIRDISLAIDTAIPVGLMMNELISNSLKYAFPKGRKGDISVAIHRQDHALTILFKDNGVGIPADFDWQNAKSLGFRLVLSLVEQLQGTIELDRAAGTAFTIVVKEKQ
jgi:PAS domain S-box-containing protein